MRRRATARLLALALSVALLWAPSMAAAKPKTHLVYAKQTLGKIAKRYNVTVDALRAANRLDKREPIRPGQRLCIPPRSDEDGSATRDACDAWRDGQAGKKRGDRKRKQRADTRPGRDGVRWHTVYKGQHLGMIAKRYNVSVAAIERANEISKKAPIIPGQQLLIPAADDPDGSRSRQWLDRGPPAEEEPAGDSSNKSWRAYARKPAHKDRVTFVGRKGRSWSGVTLTKKGNPRKVARDAFKRVLATSDGETIEIDPRLIQLVTQVSNTFGGREIKVVSGYRLGDTSRGSRHRHGKAIDFIVVGVPNEVLRDYLKSLDGVGVGYYPNSHFVHLDVREQWTYWVDYAGPGQPPRYAGFWTRRGR